MKKLFAVLVILSLISCDQQQQKVEPQIREFKFNGHTFFQMYFPGDQSSSVVHSPDCPKCLDIFD